MLQTYEATIDEKGCIHLKEPVTLPAGHRVLVTILEEAAFHVPETALLSEQSLAEDWNRPEEDAAWAHLQPVQSSKRPSPVNSGFNGLKVLAFRHDKQTRFVAAFSPQFT